MTKVNGNTGLTARVASDVDAIEQRLDGVLQRLQAAPVPAEALADAIRVLTGLQAELAASIAVRSWSRSLRAPGPPYSEDRDGG